MKAKSYIAFDALRLTVTNIDPYQGVFVLYMVYRELSSVKETSADIYNAIDHTYETRLPAGYPKVLLIDKSFAAVESLMVKNQLEYNDLKKFVLTLKSKGFIICSMSGKEISPFYPVSDINIAYLTDPEWNQYGCSSIFYEPEMIPIEKLPVIPQSSVSTSRYIVFSSFDIAAKNLSFMKDLNQIWRVSVKTPQMRFELKGV